MVTIFGLGFVGLTTALGLCEFGNTVYGTDVDPEKLISLNNGNVPFKEPGLEDALQRYLKNKLLIGNDCKTAIAESNIIFYCVGTPYGENGKADLSQLFQAIDATMLAIEDNKKRVLVIKSTVPPSSASDVVIPYLKKMYPEKSRLISVASNPEFLREGHCWDDFINADRIVIGTEDPEAERMLNDIYKASKIPVCNVNLNTAEFIKYLSNTSLACLISFANEMSLAADVIGGIDIANAFRILHADKRWQTGTIRRYMYPGCGYGGYCLPKDTNAFYEMLRNKGYDCRILEEVIKLNDTMPENTAERIINCCDGKDSVIGILGLSFNAGSDDIRDTPAAKIIRFLNEKGYKNILCFDPAVSDRFKQMYPELICDITSYEQLLKHADTIAIVTAWDMFGNIRNLTAKTLVDCRYML